MSISPNINHNYIEVLGEISHIQRLVQQIKNGTPDQSVPDTRTQVAALKESLLSQIADVLLFNFFVGL